MNLKNSLRYLTYTSPKWRQKIRNLEAFLTSAASVSRRFQIVAIYGKCAGPYKGRGNE